MSHFLPTFYEEAARAFLAAENSAYAAQLFGRARTAEAEHGLAVDQERLDAVFLEFALAGTVSAKAMSAYAKELATRLPAAEALERFSLLCLRRTAGGLVPSAQLGLDVRRLARAAGAEQVFLVDLLALPATLRAPAGWWKTHHAALVELARQRPSVSLVCRNRPVGPATPGCRMPPLAPTQNVSSDCFGQEPDPLCIPFRKDAGSWGARCPTVTP